MDFIAFELGSYLFLYSCVSGFIVLDINGGNGVEYLSGATVLYRYPSLRQIMPSVL